MKLRPSIVVGLLCLSFAVHAAADLAGDVRGVLNEKLVAKAEAGIEIARLSEGPGGMQILYQHKAGEPRIPASNLKLVTGAAALDGLGADFKYRTVLLKRGEDLVVWGDGDPTLGDTELLKQVGWEVDTVYRHWAEVLKGKGITRVRNVVIDDSIFDEQFLHPRWPMDQYLNRYVAQVAGLNFNANCLDFFLQTSGYGEAVRFRTEPATRYASVRNAAVTGGRNAVWISREHNTNEMTLRGEINADSGVPISVTVHDPALYAGTVLAETLRAAGIVVEGTVVRDRTTRDAYAKAGTAERAGWTVVAAHETPIGTVLARSNKDSVNLYADSLCKRLGAHTTGAPGSWENGVTAVGLFLRRLGVANGEFRLDDGCGLSKENAVSANTIVRVLDHAFQSKAREMWVGSMAVAGVDGTLDDRFRGTDLRGRVFAKSGFVNGVSSLSGYLQGKDGRWYAFSILFNGISPGTNSGVKVLQERIVRAIDENIADVATR